MKKIFSLLIFSLILAACSNNVIEEDTRGNNQRSWLIDAPDSDALETILCEANEDSFPLEEEGYILSISPSGKNILVANVSWEFNLYDRRPPINIAGQDAKYIALYTKNNGQFELAGRMYVDSTWEAWNDVVVSADGASVSWSPDERRVVISASCALPSQQLPSANANIFVIDLDNMAVEQLTHDYSNFLPRWIDSNSISFIRYAFNDSGDLMVKLMRMNMNSRNAQLWADLSGEGNLMFISCYAVHGNFVYYTKESFTGTQAGFYIAELTGNNANPRQLINIVDFIEYNETLHRFNLTNVQISPDGRWVILTKLNDRVMRRDIPMADCVEFPQTDPSAAISFVFNRPMAPHHHVMIFDLQNSQLANPFVSDGLRPYQVIVTAATFAPDGQSIIAAVFGDGSPWVRANEEVTTLWQIDLASPNFDAVRIYRTEVDHSLFITHISWLGSNALWIRSSTWGYRAAAMPHVLVVPGAFGGFR